MKKYISDRVFDGTRPVPKKRAQKLKSETIRKKTAKLTMKIVEAETALEVFRETCPHPTLTYVNKGYSGNWDNDEYYWREWKCHDCGKRWQTDQSYETQKQYPQAIDVSRLDYEGKHLLKKLRGIDLE